MGIEMAYLGTRSCLKLPTVHELAYQTGNLLELTDKFPLFVEHSVDQLCIVGHDGYFRLLNPQWTECLGWTVEELSGVPFFGFVHPDDLDCTSAELGKLTVGVPNILFENRYRHRDGSYRWLQWKARHTDEGSLICATARDITRIRLLETEIITIADRERERFGRDLHDGLCQSLAGIAALSVALSRSLTGRLDSAAAAAAEIAGLLRNTIGEARDIAHGLSPVGLDEGGLASVLEALALTIRRRFHIECTLVESGAPIPRLPSDAESHLFRIAQEAVSNAITHGHSECIEILLACHEGKGSLSIRDNGVGIAEDLIKRDGAGLYSMEHRARIIGGSLLVRRLERGTEVTCIFPLTATHNQSGSRNHASNSR